MSNVNILPYQLVIFDVDGTLIDSFGLFIELLNTYADKYGYASLDAKRIEQMRALPPKEIRQALSLSFLDTLRLMYDCNKQMQQHPDIPKLFAGIEDLLIQLKAQGIVLAIVTSNTRGNCLRYLGDCLYACFDYMECNASIYGKARQIKKIMQRAGCGVHQALYVGDQIIDIQSAHKNKIRSVAVTWGFNSEAALRRHHPHMIVHSVAQLQQLLLQQPVSYSA